MIILILCIIIFLCCLYYKLEPIREMELVELVENQCKHDYEFIGNFYKEEFTEYRNRFDKINVYSKERCKKCGHIQNVLLLSEEFMPQLHEGREKDDYIEFLRDRGVKLEIEL